ncbi:substrate-binding periplasmic protein [Iodobacter arcticus]|uniref:Substrate-binding periplasmic protein n=1 Tax=Iodobacter arcticus TaxID=590593 RepID=A0ABW2QU61_9NEIS
MKYLNQLWFVLLITPLAYAEALTIYANEEYRPIIYKNAQGQASGVAYELLLRHEQQTGTKVTWEMGSWRRAYELALKGRGGIVGLSKTKERSAIFDYSDPFFEVAISIVVKKGREFPLHSVNDLKGKLVGVTNGASYGPDFNSALAQKIFTADFNYSSSAQFKKLLHDRVDCLVLATGRQGLLLALNADPELQAYREQFVLLEPPLAYDPLYLGFHKSMKMKGFLLEFNKTIKAAKNSGLLLKAKN